MKKRKIIIVLVLMSLMLIPIMSVNAKSCGDIKKAKTCENKTYKNKCVWNYGNGKCEKIKSCTSYTSKKSCNNHKDNCKWKSKKCSAKSGAPEKAKSTKKKSSNKSSNTLKDVTDVDFCASTAKVWKIVGRIFQVFKILIPVILIILGSVDFGKAVLDKEDAVYKAFKRLIVRILSALVIFLLPTIITALIGLFVGFSKSGAADDYKYCQTCITSPGKCDTSKDASNNNSLN